MGKREMDDEHVRLREKIIIKASSLFTRRGVRDVTMDEISKCLKISKRTLYEMFEDKEQLLIACMERHNKIEKDIATEIIANTNNVLEVIFKVYEESIRGLHEMNFQFFIDVRQYPNAKAHIDRHREAEFKETVSFFRQGIDQGLFLPNINFEIFVLMMRDQIDLIFEMKRWNQYSFFEMFDLLMTTFLRGVSIEKGIKVIDEFMTKYRSQNPFIQDKK